MKRKSVEKSLERINKSLSEVCCALRNVPVAELDAELTRQLTCALELVDVALDSVLEAQIRMREGVVRNKGTALQQFLEHYRADGRYGQAIAWALAGLGSICAMWLGPDGFVRALKW